ncbi:AAA family ATPase [Planktothrix paucivesiculata]|uniref:Endonuclease GajA/Old nuclease/RecF-like AAA domain-containing protein n=1 Tax=Planktothrix paucivesiculata PCC 9631 TaxID=671071 RepID=A0A7Z9BT52_9CYAN|nr:ATP-binding protein [Planktothrix paucivesiculata]VXD22248.1 conserved hypothetical protein [Planktothrix paucivesiculata PCC 9631]
MVEKLIIDNFAGIEHLEIEVKKINIMIGPQASGKSVCAKLLFYFKEFVSELINFVENEKTKRQFDSFCSYKFKEYFPPKFWGDHNFNLRYEIDNHFIKISRNKSKFNVIISYSDSYKSALNNLRMIHRKVKDEILENPSFIHSNFLVSSSLETKNYCEKILGKESTYYQSFIPAIRSFFAHIEKNIFLLLSHRESLDPFIENFGKLYEITKHFLDRNELKIEQKILTNGQLTPLVEKILCGKYFHEKGEDFLETSDGRKISISTCSSGQQETLPLVIILSTMPFIQSIMPFIQPIVGGQTIYIEEPEAHVFPTAQKYIVELIATVFNTNPDGLQFFITTHSPYILTATNNLLQAGLIYQDANDQVIEKLEKIVPRYKTLLTKDVAVYSLMDGFCKSIISEETGLIDTNIIDSVSEELAIEFDQLLDLI